MRLGTRIARTAKLWIVVWPTATAVIAIVGPFVAHLALPLRTLATSLIIVTLVANVTGPLGGRLGRLALGLVLHLRRTTRPSSAQRLASKGT